MSINFGKYKTYDTSDGFGSTNQWKKAWEAIFGSTMEDFIKDTFEELNEEKKKSANELANEIRKNNSENLKLCKTVVELKSKFKELLFKYHPDKAGNTKENNEKCAKIIEEYEVKLKQLTKNEYKREFKSR